IAVVPAQTCASPSTSTSSSTIAVSAIAAITLAVASITAPRCSTATAFRTTPIAVHHLVGRGDHDDRARGNYHETLGLVRMLNGNFEQARYHFNIVKESFFLKNLQPKRREKREHWFTAIDSGEDPFTPKVLEELRRYEG
ncbi:MAG: hypothetical protein ACPGVO_22585, partial [Spirulinaceae cyanobacterium]